MGFRKKLICCCIAMAIALICVAAPVCISMNTQKVFAELKSLREVTGESMRVLWTISAYYIGPNARWEDSQAKAFLFKPLDIGSSVIVFDGKACRDVQFEAETVDAKSYFTQRHGISPRKLGLEEETIRVIKTNCRLEGFAEYIRLADRRLIVVINGVFFFFAPNVNYSYLS